MKNRLLLLILLCCLPVLAQTEPKLDIDQYGYVNDDSFKTYIKNRGYQLVGSFMPIDADSTMYYARVLKAGKWGFIDVYGREVIHPKFDFVDDFRDGYAQVMVRHTDNTDEESGSKHWLINALGIRLLPEYDTTYHPVNGITVVKVKGKFGAVNNSGVEILAPVYTRVYVKDKFLIVGKDRRFAVFSTSGEPLTDFIYTEIRYRIGLIMGFVNDTFAILDPKTAQPLNNEWYFENSCTTTRDMSVYAVSNEKGCHLINSRGDVLSGYYKELRAIYDNNNFLAKGASGSGVIDNAGKEVIPCSYFNVGCYDGKMYKASKNGVAVYFNEKYEPVDFSAYQKVGEIKNGFAVVWLNGKVGFADYTGKLVIPAQYDNCDLGFESDGLARVTVKGKHGLIDRKGNVVAPFEYSYIMCQDGLCQAVAENGKAALYTAKGQIAPAVYSSVSMIKGTDALFTAKKDGLFGIIDANNRIVVPFEYTDMSNKRYANGLIYARKGNMAGCITVDGIVRVPIAFNAENMLTDNKTGIIGVMKGEDMYYADYYGNVFKIEI